MRDNTIRLKAKPPALEAKAFDYAPSHLRVLGEDLSRGPDSHSYSVLDGMGTLLTSVNLDMGHIWSKRGLAFDATRAKTSSD